MNLFNQIFAFLIETMFSGYLLILLLRIILEGLSIHRLNPIFQGLVKLTEPVLQPIRRFIPRYGRWEISGIMVAIILSIIRYGVLMLVGQLPFFNWFQLSILGLFAIGNVLIDIFFYAILIDVLLSWLNPTLKHPLNECLVRIVQPVLSPIRSRLPAFSGIDFSSLIALIGLKILAMIVNKIPLIFFS